MVISTANLHPDDAALYDECCELAIAAAKHFGFRLDVIETKRRPHPGGHDGLCYQGEFRISFVIRYRVGKEWYRKPLPSGYVLDIVLHEVCHLGGLKDGPAHRTLWDKAREWARGAGYVIGKEQPCNSF